MQSLTKERGLLIVGGAVVALVIGVVLALALRGKPTTTTPPVGAAGLVVESAEAGRIDPGKTLRCFVGGQLVGELTLAECATRNGVAAGALDVGIDSNGQLGAATQASADLAPLPPAEAAMLPPTASTPAAPPAPGPQAAATPTPLPVQRVAIATCWRYENNGWTRLPGDQPLNTCVQTLYAGRCERVGAAAYGRWGEQTLRLIPRRVEISNDNRSFRTLVEQAADCSLPPIP